MGDTERMGSAWWRGRRSRAEWPSLVRWGEFWLKLPVRYSPPEDAEGLGWMCSSGRAERKDSRKAEVLVVGRVAPSSARKEVSRDRWYAANAANWVTRFTRFSSSPGAPLSRI